MRLWNTEICKTLPFIPKGRCFYHVRTFVSYFPEELETYVISVSASVQQDFVNSRNFVNFDVITACAYANVDLYCAFSIRQSYAYQYLRIEN